MLNGNYNSKAKSPIILRLKDEIKVNKKEAVSKFLSKLIIDYNCRYYYSILKSSINFTFLLRSIVMAIRIGSSSSSYFGSNITK